MRRRRVPQFFRSKAKKPLDLQPCMHMFGLAQIARACGRVSVGGDLDKRPVNRRNKTGSRSEPANPAKRGTRLKATTDRAFSSRSTPPKVGVPKRLVSLAGRADRVLPFQSMATDTLIACAIALVLGVVRVRRRCTGSHCSSPTVRRKRAVQDARYLHDAASTAAPQL